MKVILPHRATAPFSGFGFRGKIVACAVLSAVLALAAGASLGGGRDEVLAACAMTGSLLVILAMTQLLRPVGVVVRKLELYLAGGAFAGFPRRHGGEIGRLMTMVGQLVARLDAVARQVPDGRSVTSLPSKGAFLTAIAMELAAGAKSGVLGVIRFRDYDELAVFDQQIADRTLHAISSKLRGMLKSSRHLAQVDRDCFGLWFGDLDNSREAVTELRAIGYVLGQDCDVDGRSIAPEFSLAAARYPQDAEDPAVLLTQAFAALSSAGPTTTGSVELSSPGSTGTARERFALTQDLRHAINADQFLMLFQPVVDLDKGGVVGAEALLRWRHPRLGLISPAIFIPLLEKSGLMTEVGLWVLNTACREARRWREGGLAGLKVAVNVSALQLRDGSLPAVIERTLAHNALTPAELEIELTETAALEDDGRTRALLGDLRDIGVSVAIDDFGTGYSSLSKLKNLPFSKLKIDREFVTGVDVSRDNQAICGSLVELARGLGMAVLAEGTETAGEVRALRGLGCPMFQGFFFARPLGGAEFETTIRDPQWLTRLASPAPGRDATQRRRVESS